MARPHKVAVIGAGPSGLLAARELKREGYRPVVYEKQSRLGGTWVYDPQVESDPLSLDPNREIVHSSIYHSLCTNLPKVLMGFSDYPFDGIKGNDDPRDFATHEEVLKFLEKFAVKFGLNELIKFNEEVVKVESSVGDHLWMVESRNGEKLLEEVFDAVVICNGHHTEPLVAEIPGSENFPGKQIHSHNYRVPKQYQGQVVVVIGNGPSAIDISKQIAKVAKEVHLSSRSPTIDVSKQVSTDPNIWQHPKVDYVFEDGKIAFRDGVCIQADIILHCTGYKYHFPFLKVNGVVTVEDNRVGPLYKHVFPPQLAPRISFVGLPARTIIFRTLELQAKWVAKVLSGKTFLPSKEEMLADVEQHYKHMKEMGLPQHQTHFLDPFKFDYVDWLAAQAGVMPVEEQLKDIYRLCLEQINSMRFSRIHLEI